MDTPQASASLATATKLFEWMNDELNEEVVKVFAKKLIDCIHNCLPTDDTSMSTKIQREKMWKSYHSLRTSDTFVKLWHDFLDLAALAVADLGFYKGGSDEQNARKELAKCLKPRPLLR